MGRGEGRMVTQFGCVIEQRGNCGGRHELLEEVGACMLQWYGREKGWVV